MLSDSLRNLFYNRSVVSPIHSTFLAHLSRRAQASYCHSASSIRPSVRRPALTFTFYTSPLKPLNGIKRNLTGNKNSLSTTKFMFLGPIKKSRWPPWSLIGWDIFYFSSETAERNSTKLDRKHYLNVLYQVYVFPANQKNKMATMASDWLRHFRRVLWNRWTEFTTKLERNQDLNVLKYVCVFRADRKNKMAAPVSDWLKQFSTSPLKSLNGIQRSLTGSNIWMSSNQFVFFGLIGNQDGCPSLWLAAHTFDFSSETTDRNSTKLERKQDLNMQFFFWGGGGGDPKN